MSKQIDDRVVSMQFDNTNFEKNVKTSMSTLDKLKQALTFKGATKGLEAVESASKKVNFTAMSNAVDEVGVRFSAMQVIATTALANITNAAVNAGKRVVEALTVEPVISGFREYETQIGSIQTILSNTRWQNTSLDQVNSALDELNAYADKTIYNFTEMTRNIGTFTAAGVGLEDSVQAIKGIANLAAVSGSSSAQASSAMYQLSQALAAGRVSLMDWNSVVNAGMGGKVFQDALVRTSELLGTGAKQAIETYGSFRESLTKGQWLTTEVLTETLKQISGAYTEADLISQGYTKEQAAEIMALAKDAEGAATNVRTFSQLIDTTMEALGSGWTQTWELIIGDFEEAQELWTNISNYLNEVVNNAAEARNNILQGWRDLGGREALLAGLQNIFDGLLSVIQPIQEVFAEFFPPMTAETLMDITNNFKDFTSGLKLSTEATENLKSVVRGILSFFEMLVKVGSNVIDFFGNFVQNAEGVFKALGDFAAGIGDFFTSINAAMEDGSAFNAIIEALGSAFGQAASSVADFFASGIGKIGEIFNSITPDQIMTFLNALTTGAIVKFVKDFTKNLKNIKKETSGLSDVLVDVLSDLTKGFSGAITGVLDAVKDSLVAWQQSIKANALLKIAIAVALLANAVSQLASLDVNALQDSLGAVTILFSELVGSMLLFEKFSAGFTFGAGNAIGLISMAAAIDILASALIKVSDLDGDAIARGVTGLAELAAIMVLASKGLSMGEGKIATGTVQLIAMAAALKIMASVVDDLSELDMDQMSQGLQGIGALLVEIVAFNALLNGGNNLLAVSASLILIGAAMKILASSVKDLGGLETGEAIQGIAAINAVLSSIAVFSNLVDADALLKTFIPLLGVVGALHTIALSLSKLAVLDGNGLAASVASIGAVLGELTAFSHLLPDEKKLNAVAGAIPLMGIGLLILAQAIETLSDLNIEQVGVAVAGFAGSMATLFVGIKAVSGNEKQIAILMLAATALTVMAAAIKLLSTVGVLGVALSLGSLAGTFIILGGATKLLGPLAPSMLKIAAAVAAFGGSLIAIGAGSAAIGVGLSVALTALVGSLAAVQGSISSLDPSKTAVAIGILVGSFAALAAVSYVLSPLAPTMLAVSGSIAMFGLLCAAVAGSIWLMVAAISALGNLSVDSVQNGMTNLSTIIMGLVDMIPQIVGQLGEMFKNLLLGVLDTIVEVAPQFVDTLLVVLEQLLASLNEHVPAMVDFILTFLIQVINGVAARVPELVGAISNLVNSLVTAIFDAMSGWSESGNSAETALKFFAGATGLVVALNAIKGMIPGAMAGALGMAAFVTELGAIFAALGALEQLTGASSFINSAGDLLQSLGTAMGQFIGGLIGGVAEGITSTLPQVGTNLSQFAMNVIPFLTAMQMVDQSTIDGVVNLAGAIAALAGANFVDAVTTFLSGGNDFTSLGPKLVSFGEAIVDFSNTVTGIDVEAVNAAANCGEALAALATSLPKEGGLAQAIFGETTDFDTFGEQLVSFGEAIKEYSETVQDLDVESVVNSAKAGQAMSDLAATLPKDGGLASAIFGESTDFDTFGDQLVSFGEALVSYAEAVTDLDVESINTSVQAGQALSDLANALPDDGGLSEWIFGGSDLGSFGTTLVQFGNALKNYANSLVDIDFNAIQQSVNNVNNLRNVLTNFTDVDTSGIENLASIKKIGTAIAAYYDAISGYDVASLGQSIDSLYSLRDFITSLTGIDTSGISSFSTALTQLGEVSLDGLIATFSNASLASVGQNLATTFSSGFTTGMASAQVTVSSAVAALGTLLSSKTTEFQSAGSSAASAYATGVQNGVSGVKTAVSEMVSSAASSLGDHYSTFYEAGKNLALGFANGISSSAYAASTAARAMANAAARAAQQALDEHSPSKVMQQIGEYAGQGFTLGLENYVSLSEQVGTDMASAVARGASTVGDMLDSAGVADKIANAFRSLSASLGGGSTSDSTEDTAKSTSSLASALDSMASSLDSVISRKNDLKAIDKVINRTGVAFTESFVDEMLNSSGQFAGAITEMANLTDEQLQQMVDAFTETEILEQINELTDSVDGEDNSLVEALSNAGTSITEFAKDANTLGFSLDDIASKVSDFAESISDGFSELSTDSQTTLQEFKDNLENNYAVAQEWASNVEKVFGMIPESMQNSEYIQNFKKQVIEGGFEKWGQIIADLANSNSQQEIFEFAQLLQSVSNSAANLSADVANTLVRSVNSLTDSGARITEGVASGVESGIPNVASAIETMCASADESVRSYFGINSPSKLMYKIGQYIVEGLIQGISDASAKIDGVYELIHKEVESLLNLSNNDSEFTVTVTPIVDMDDFNNKMNLLNSAYANSPSVEVLGNLASINSRIGQNGVLTSNAMLMDSVNGLANKLDALEAENFGVVYNQYNNSPKALDAGTIYRQTKNQLSLAKSKRDHR